MRYVVRYDNTDRTWLVVDTLSVGQTVGRHLARSGALIQAESEERRWRRLGAGAETFALVAVDADRRIGAEI